MTDLTPEKRAELRELAERARPHVRHGGTDPAATYIPAADLLALLDAADERDRVTATTGLAAIAKQLRSIADQIDPPPPPVTRHRDAITGQYVDADEAAARPETTVRETRKP